MNHNILAYRSIAEEGADWAADFVGCFSNAARLKILCLLAKSEFSVGELARQVGLSQSATSQHLAKLRVHQIVKARRDSQTIYYSCTNPLVIRFLNQLSDLL